MIFLADDNDKGVLLNLYVQPRSSKNKISGIHGNALKLCLTTPPVDGKANKAVIDFFAKFFGLPKTSVTLKSGEKSRNKQLKLTGIPLTDAKKILQQSLRA